MSKNNLFIILFISILFTIIIYLIYQVNILKQQNLLVVSNPTPTPTVLPTSSPLQPTTVPNTNPVPPAVNSLFNDLNNSLNLNIKPTYVSIDYFYFGGQYIKSKVWQLNFGKSLNEKTKINELLRILQNTYSFEMSDGGGDGGGVSVTTYQNELLECTLRFDNMSATLSCLPKK